MIMENRIKPETAPTLSELQSADIRTVMATGDNMLTGLSIARHCGMIDSSDDVYLVNFMITSPDSKQLLRPSIQYERVAFETTKDSSKLRISDEPSGGAFHLAITGSSWSLLRKHYPQEVNRIVVKATVFARMSPEQKQQLIETLQDIGYYVGMCGDGANDCGALKTAHAGISLSETEASVASPFTSKQPNISCVTTVIKEGRAALVTSLGVFKFMACYSMTCFATVCLLYWFNANLSGFAFLYIDLVLITSLSVTFGHTAAYPTLVAQCPQPSLLALVPVLSIILQITINFLVQFLVWFFTQSQPWYEPFVLDIKDHYNFTSHIMTCVFMVSLFQYVTLAVVFSTGAPYRQPFYTNRLFLCNVLVCLAINIFICLVDFSTYLQSLPGLIKFVQHKPPPSIAYRLLIVGVAVMNFLLCYIVEIFVVQSDLINSLQENVKSKNAEPRYKTIEREIQSDPKWPPIGNHDTSDVSDTEHHGSVS